MSKIKQMVACFNMNLSQKWVVNQFKTIFIACCLFSTNISFAQLSDSPVYVCPCDEGCSSLCSDLKFNKAGACPKCGMTLQLYKKVPRIFKIFAEQENKFFLKAVEASIEFLKDGNGNVLKLVLKQNGQAIEAFKG